MEAQSRAVNAASENARLAELAYENGAGTQVIDAQRQLQRVRFGLIQANAELRRDIAALFVATASDWRGAAPEARRNEQTRSASYVWMSSESRDARQVFCRGAEEPRQLRARTGVIQANAEPG